MKKPGFSHPEEWRLFTDATKLSLKAVLLHNGNVQPLVAAAHSVATTESLKVCHSYQGQSVARMTVGRYVVILR